MINKSAVSKQFQIAIIPPKASTSVDDRETIMNGSSQHGNSVVPKCICSWRHCRTFQKQFRDSNHPVFDGVIKLKFVKDHPASQALKDSIDRVLRVAPDKADDWKPGRKEGQYVIRYYIARHHYTEKHIQKFLQDQKGFSFLKPFSVHGAKKYLYAVDPNETFQLPNADPNAEPLYLQTPNVPKEVVKAEYQRLRGEPVEEEPPVPPPAPAPTPKSRHHAVAAQSPQHAPKQIIGDKKDSLTVSTTRSSSYHQRQQLKTKEEENKKLKDELEMMKSQLTFLHDMVRKLQEEHFGGGGGTTVAGDHQSVRSGRSYRSRSVSNRQQRGSGRSARSGVPREINLGDDDEDDHVDDDSDRRTVNDEHETWREEGEDLTSEGYGSQSELRHHYEYEDEDEQTTNTFQVTYKAARRNSGGTQATMGAASIVSASKSVKTLPRELELDEDEDDSESHDSLEEEAFDNRSFASAAHSRQSRSMSIHSRGTASRRSNDDDQSYHSSKRNSAKPDVGQQDQTNMKKPSRRGSIGENSQRSSRSARSTGTGGGTYEVAAMDVTDPYGEKGTYTGSISNSTGMPHGYGRLEYDRAGRWYEGDWKHGRWTGHGRLSNGDGDYYEGGLKNDHKRKFIVSMLLFSPLVMFLIYRLTIRRARNNEICRRPDLRRRVHQWPNDRR